VSDQANTLLRSDIPSGVMGIHQPVRQPGLATFIAISVRLNNEKVSTPLTNLKDAVDRISRATVQCMERHGIPGAAIIITDRQRTLHLSTHGLANIDSGEAVSQDHLFMSGSIGKSFTAIATLQLYEEGKLDLRDPVAKYLPWFETAGDFEPVTIHHLLTHTAGIHGMNDVLTGKLFDVWVLRNARANHPPGQGYHYSNVGYKTLGLVLETLDGAGYGEIIRRRILDRLGMTATHPETTHETRHRLATGYLPFYDDRPWLPHHGLAPAAWLEIASGDGCICTPVEELAIYLRALMNRDPVLLTNDSYELLTGKQVEVEPNHWYGYGIDTDEIDGQTLISHGGEMPGHKCYMFANLDTNLGFIIMANGFGPLFELSLYANNVLAAVSSGQPLPELPTIDNPLEVHDAGDFAGHYVDLATHEPAFELVASEHRLSLRFDGSEADVWRIEEGAFVADHPDFCRLPLRFDDNKKLARHGDAQYFRVGDSTIADAPRREPVTAVERDQISGHYCTYGSVFTNFRITADWDGELVFVHPSGEEQRLQHIDAMTWRFEDMPETVSFNTFVDGQALVACFSGCDYCRTFTL
jgi:D-alanyl-D-alanine carboxypeptidase